MTPRVVASAILCRYCSKKALMEALDPGGTGNLGLIADSTTDKRARQIRITPEAHEYLQPLAFELGMTLWAVASHILCHYCSKEDFKKALAG